LIVGGNRSYRDRRLPDDRENFSNFLWRDFLQDFFPKDWMRAGKNPGNGSIVMGSGFFSCRDP
jgi:hypothetical protein